MYCNLFHQFITNRCLDCFQFFSVTYNASVLILRQVITGSENVCAFIFWTLSKCPPQRFPLLIAVLTRLIFCNFANRVGYKAFLPNLCISSYSKNWYLGVDLICILKSGIFLYVSEPFVHPFISIDPLPIFFLIVGLFLILICTKSV